MERPERAVGKIDVDRPSSARIYDYFLGGAHNFEVDRIAAGADGEDAPGHRTGHAGEPVIPTQSSQLSSPNRVSIQFLDLGSGIPTVGNVHEIAQRANPEARVAYVDIEPIAVTHSNTILADNDLAIAIRADLRDPDEVLTNPRSRSCWTWTGRSR